MAFSLGYCRYPVDAEIIAWTHKEATRLALTHTALQSEYWDQFGPGAVGVGWEMAFLGLALHIADPSAPKPNEKEFAVSPEGRTFITGSSEGWAQAAITAGTEPEVARATAARTAASYTGEG